MDIISEGIHEYGEIHEALGKLKPDYRTLLYLYYVEGYKVHEIAKICKLCENTIYTRLRRAREQLKKEWENILYTSVKELEEQYHLSLLQSPMAYEWDEKYTMIPDCIYGDKEDEFFQEYEYQTPIFYSAYFSVSRENVKLERKWERDYERKVKLERYISSKNGVEAMISCEPFEIEGESKGYHPNTQAVFVVDNIEYTLTGRVEIETMKKIIDSLHS